METNLFTLLSLVIVVAVLVSALMRLLRQPLIIGYILTGVLAGPSFLHLIPDAAPFKAFSSIGIALLLFIIGLGLSTEVIRRLGKVVLATASIQMVFTVVIGYLAGITLGMSPIESLVAGLAVAFSSTIIIIKLFSDKREQTRLYGQVALGILLLQDVVATLALVMLAAGKNGGVSPLEAGLLAVKGIVIGGVLLLLGTKLLPKLAKFTANSQEFLFLFALAWGFGVATLFELAGFSIEVGALFAGVSLAGLPYAQEIAAKLKPLRDFFVVVFFIALGEGLRLGNLLPALLPAIGFSIIVIAVKPLTVLITMGLLGYTRRTSFKTAVSLSQISEFSIVFVVLATTIGLVSEQLSAITTVVAIITIAVSTYLMKYDDELFEKLERFLRLFERKSAKDEHHRLTTYPLILFGYRQGGEQFVKSFQALHHNYVVVDYDPDVIEVLEQKDINHIYGDATDVEFLEELNLAKARLIVATIYDPATTLYLVRHVTAVNPDAIIICHADDYKHAADLYHAGATYVMIPHLIGSEKISTFIRRAGLHKDRFVHYRNEHLILLEERAQ